MIVLAIIIVFVAGCIAAAISDRGGLVPSDQAESPSSPEPCDGMDGALPCSKWAGHDGPHYFYRP